MKKVFLFCLFVISTFVLYGSAFAVLYHEDVDYLLDVSRDAWYRNGVRFVVSHGVMTTVGDLYSRFNPAKKVTRAMLATALEKFATNVHFEQGQRVFTDSWNRFRLVFPDSWEGYLVSSYYTHTYSYDHSVNWSISSGSEEHETAVHDFGFLNEKGEFETFFVIRVWPDGGEDSIKSERIAEKDDIAITLNQIKTSAKNPRIITDIQKIKDSFQWIEN